MNPALPASHRTAVTRRSALKLTMMGLAGTAVGAGGSAVFPWLAKGRPGPYRFFTDAEAELLVAICEQIIPRDDVGGATDAGVIHYIDRQVAAGMLREHAPTYRRGLEAFRLTCLAAHQAAFTELSTEAKTEVLRTIEAARADPAPWGEPAQDAFFRLVVDHTMQGFYGSPRHGGNRGYLSYRMLGLDYPQVLGRNKFRSLEP